MVRVVPMCPFSVGFPELQYPSTSLCRVCTLVGIIWSNKLNGILDTSQVASYNSVCLGWISAPQFLIKTIMSVALSDEFRYNAIIKSLELGKTCHIY